MKEKDLFMIILYSALYPRCQNYSVVL